MAVLALLPASILALHLKAAVEEVAARPWVQSMRAKGMREEAIWFGAIARASLPAALALVPALFAYLVAASMVVEDVFLLPGVGPVALRAAVDGDAPVLVGLAVCTVVAVRIATGVTQCISRTIDPRRRS